MGPASATGPIRLLDVNLLVAMAWPHHVMFAAAQRWFGQVHAQGWATTPVTEAGLARVSMNPAVAGRLPSWTSVLELVRRLRAVDGHHRWIDGVDLVDDPVVRRARIVGHRQVSDVLLAAQAARHGGRLATVDAGVIEALHPDDRHLVEVVPII
jgi:toxin-antitoxin system PIN domain toxin